MDEIRQVPLAERIRGAISSDADIPKAMGMCTIDLLEVVGEMTGLKERFGVMYRGFVEPYEGEESPRRVCKLVADALGWEPEERTEILYWLLAEPFAVLYNTEGREES